MKTRGSFIIIAYVTMGKETSTYWSILGYTHCCDQTLNTDNITEEKHRLGLLALEFQSSAPDSGSTVSQILCWTNELSAPHSGGDGAERKNQKFLTVSVLGEDCVL